MQPAQAQPQPQPQAQPPPKDKHQHQPKPPKSQATSMRVKIYAPFKVYYDDEANSVTANNRVGQFDVLAQHHNFISLLEPGDVTVRKNGQPDFVMPISL